MARAGEAERRYLLSEGYALGLILGVMLHQWPVALTAYAAVSIGLWAWRWHQFNKAEGGRGDLGSSRRALSGSPLSGEQPAASVGAHGPVSSPSNPGTQ